MVIEWWDFEAARARADAERGASENVEPAMPARQVGRLLVGVPRGATVTGRGLGLTKVEEQVDECGVVDLTQLTRAASASPKSRTASSYAS